VSHRVHELPLKVQFVRFRLPVPPPEEVDHPFHASLSSPPCLPPLPLLVLLIKEGIDLKEGTQAKIFCAIQTREVSLWGKGVLKAQLLQSWPKFEDGMDVEDWDGQVERL